MFVFQGAFPSSTMSMCGWLNLHKIIFEDVITVWIFIDITMPRSAMHQMKNDENVQNWDYKILICTQVMMVRILPVESSQQIIVILALCNWEIQKMNKSMINQFTILKLDVDLCIKVSIAISFIHKEEVSNRISIWFPMKHGWGPINQPRISSIQWWRWHKVYLM